MFSCELVFASMGTLQIFRSLSYIHFSKSKLKLHEVGCPDVFIDFIEMNFFDHSEVYEIVFSTHVSRKQDNLQFNGNGGGPVEN